jgi:hypothetical protein
MGFGLRLGRLGKIWDWPSERGNLRVELLRSLVGKVAAAKAGAELPFGKLRANRTPKRTSELIY